ncbi:hypothetical protein Tco_0567247 [Tanacetum coccineum]
MESLISNFQEIELHETQLVVKQLHSVRMLWFEQLETHLSNLYHNKLSRAADAFKPAFLAFFDAEHQTFGLKMFHNLDQLKLQFKRENLHEVSPLPTLMGLMRKDLYSRRDTFQGISCSQKGKCNDLLTQQYKVNAKGDMGSQLHDEILHEHLIKVKCQDAISRYSDQSVQAMDGSLIVSKSSLIEPENNNAVSAKAEIEYSYAKVKRKRSLCVKAVDGGWLSQKAVASSHDKQDTSSSSGIITHKLWMQISDPVNNDKEQLLSTIDGSALHNILANEQQHTEQSEPNYDTHLLETIDSNTTPTSTNMCHRGGEIDQDALLNAELLKTKDMVCMEVYNELSKRFLQLEKHCISLEISIQQKEESFHSNKPCKNKEYPEFREFFVINDLKAQLQAKTTLICDLKNQIKSVKEASNEAKVKNDIDVIETINIELEHSVAKLLAANEQLHKEKEHLKQTYKELYDTIKKTRVQNKDNSDSLISQINQKSVENVDLKAQIQEKVFANAALKNELRKLKGNIVDSKFAKASILGKPPLQPSRNHLVVRQPNAFTSERPRMSRPRFASQVDEKNDLSKTVTPHYLPKVRESAAAKPHQVNAPNYSRNSHKESYGSNDMVHAYFLEDARKMTQDKTRIPNHRDMASTRAHCTPNACTPKPRNIYRSSPVSKCSGGMSNGEPLVDHSRNSSFFLDSKQFVCSICHKYIFNTNHDDCITKILNKVNSRAKVQSPKIRNNNPVEPKNHTHKPGRQNGIGQRFSLNKSSAVHEKPHTPRSCLRWKPTGRIFKTVSLRWIPTGKVFIDSTTKVDSEPPNGSNDDITNPYECNQTLYVSAGTSNSSAGLVLHLDVVWTKQFKPRSSSKDVWIKQFRPRLRDSLLHDNIIPKPDLALEIGPPKKTVGYCFQDDSLYCVKEEGLLYSSKKLKGISNSYPAEQEMDECHKLLTNKFLEWEADVDSEHFDRDDNTGDDNEETKPDPEEIYNSGPAPSLMTPGYISSGLVQISVSPTPYVPPSKKDYEILAVDPVGSPSSTTIDQDEQSTSTSPTNQEIQSQVTHQGPVPQFMAPDHSSSGPVLHEMTSDQIRSDLTPNRQETSVDNISSDLVSNKQKASDYDISGPVPPRKNVVSLADKTDSSQKEIEFLFNHFFEEYFSPINVHAEENNNDQAANASHEYQWTKDHPLEQVIDNPTNPVQTRQQLATDPEMCMFALTVSTEEPKNSKEAMADSAWIEAMQDELH